MSSCLKSSPHFTIADMSLQLGRCPYGELSRIRCTFSSHGSFIAAADGSSGSRCKKKSWKLYIHKFWSILYLSYFVNVLFLCYLSCVICRVLSFIVLRSCVTFLVLPFLCYLSCVTCLVLSFLYYLSCITFLVLPFLCYLSCVTCLVFSFLYYLYCVTFIFIFKCYESSH